MTARRWLPAALVACWLGARPAHAEVTEWVLASVAPEGSPLTAVLDRAARSLERLAGGRVRIKTRYGGMLGDESTTLELCQRGRIQIWAGSMAAVEGVIPGLAVFGTPYLFPDVATFDRAVKTGALFDRPLVARAFRDKGLVAHSTAFVGWRALSSRSKALRVPSDARGLRPRSQPGSQQGAMWRLLGAEPREIALADVRAAFEGKQVDSIDIPLLYLFAASLASEIRFHTRTDHVLQAGLLAFSREAFEKLPKSAQAAILKNRLETTAGVTKVHEDLEVELLAALEAQKVEVLRPGAADREAWRRALAPLRMAVSRMGGPVGAEILRSLQGKP